ncbi:MAG: hypothetical protein M3010_01665, partial [Candidatus Dormibacteraeota bacterium]|nr:hypothetical protein [Candidatus Dormibacteraeota bacterium]
FVVRLWDPERRCLVKALVSASSLKGVFFVDHWDSRTGDQADEDDGPSEALPAAAPPETELDRTELTESSPTALPGPAQRELRGPMLVEEPALIDDRVVAVVVADSGEHRPSFRSALTPRRLVGPGLPGPEELRYRLLRARIGELLGQPGPPDHEYADAADEEG